MTTLRDFSAAGPCITLGAIVNEGPRFWRITDRNGGTRRVLKTSYRGQCGLLHASPCKSCCDHPETTYPNGYMD